MIAETVGTTLIVGVALKILNVKFPVPLPVVFEALTTTVPFPADVGVPLMTPVSGSKLSPAGHEPLVKA